MPSSPSTARKATAQLPPHLHDLEPFSSTSPTRFHSLYSDFARQKSSNPTSYQANVQWWRKGLESLVSSGRQATNSESNRFVLKANREFLERLRIEKLGKPMGLGTAISELCKSGSLVPEQTFTSSPKSLYDPGSIAYRVASFMIGKPFWWALEQGGIVGEDSYLSSIKTMVTPTGPDQWFGQFVVVTLLEAAADKVLQLQEDSTNDGLYGYPEFRRTFASIFPGSNVLREDEAVVLVKFLERDRGLVVSDGAVIKFVRTPDEKTITAVDRGVLELRSAVFNLHRQVESLQSRCEELTQKAKDALARSQKSMALSNIRLKRQLEELLSKRLGALENLEATLITVEGARGDVEIMKTYETSTSTLKNILSHPSLQADKVDETMDALASANAEAKEIDQTIRDSADIALGVGDLDEDDDIEKELLALVEQQGAEELSKMPQVPSTPVKEKEPEKPATQGEEEKVPEVLTSTPVKQKEGTSEESKKTSAEPEEPKVVSTPTKQDAPAAENATPPLPAALKKLNETKDTIQALGLHVAALQQHEDLPKLPDVPSTAMPTQKEEKEEERTRIAE